MATIGTPQQQAGILSFYDAPSKGPLVSPKLAIALVAVFAVIVLIFDHFAAL